MADMHVLAGSGSEYTVVMHFPVLDADNSVGVNYRTALVNSGLGGRTAMTEGTGPGQITAAEKAQVEAGELIEHTMQVSVDGVGVTSASRLALLRILYASGKLAALLELVRQLKFYGFTADEV